MRLGMYCNYTQRIAEFASRVGFESMELAAWPKSTIHVGMDDASLKAVLDDLNRRDIQISALGFYPNFLYPDQDEAAEQRDYMMGVIELAHRMGVDTIGTHAGNDFTKPLHENIPQWKEVFSRFVDAAAKHGIRIALENCPMADNIMLHRNNLAYSPEIWQVLFSELPAENLGLEFDPAHMVWQGIDYVQAVYDFGHKIFHVHAKDVEVRHKELAIYGVFGPQFPGHKRHWRGRAAGWGDVRWREFLTALIETGYKGNIDIEHEDDVFFNAAKDAIVIHEEQDQINNYSAEEDGMILGFNTLRPLIPEG